MAISILLLLLMILHERCGCIFLKIKDQVFEYFKKFHAMAEREREAFKVSSY